jgi:hypothetical protein
MLKVFFPGGDELQAPGSLAEIESGNMNMRTNNPQQDTSIRLISRIFSMISLQEIGINLNGKDMTKVQNLQTIDFDISQFCTLIERYKFTWRTAF